MVARDARIQCGNSYISWDQLDTFRARCRYSWEASVQESALHVFDLQAIKLAVHHTIFDLQKAPLRALLQAFSSSKCADVRDKIYGLDGLAKAGGDLEIDYSKTVSEVFVDVIMLQKYDDCRVLVSYSQFLQRTFKGEVDTPLPVFRNSPELYVGALGYEIGTISKLQTMKFDTPLTHSQLETTKKAIRGRVMPIFNNFSCGVKGGVEFVAEYFRTDGENRLQRPWQQLNASLWTQLRLDQTQESTTSVIKSLACSSMTPAVQGLLP